MADNKMKAIVFSHKLVWESPDSPTGYATDGGFAFHMKAISEIFDEMTIVVPRSATRKKEGEVPIHGHNVKVLPVEQIEAANLARKIRMPFWILKNAFRFRKLIKDADAVHVPIPSDMGTIGMVLAKWMDKPLFVRYCGNWLVTKTKAEQFWHWFMEKYAGGKNVMLTTGLELEAPSAKNENIKWIFSSSLTREEISHLKKHKPTLDTKAPRLIIVCRQDKAKGPGEVIRAVSFLKDEFPGVHLDVVGDGPDLPLFKKIATDVGVEQEVTFHGKVNHERVLELLQQAHLFCYPTRSSEGFPKVVLEALASGLPVLGTPVSAIRNLLSEGGGILLKDHTAEEVAEAVRYMLHHPDQYEDIQEKAIHTADRFTLETWRDTIKEHLEKAWKTKLHGVAERV